MKVREIEAKSILLKRKYIDSWFVSRYGMNLYRGCQHNCAYCDGRAEGYLVRRDLDLPRSYPTGADSLRACSVVAIPLPGPTGLLPRR
jgi:hypothetical protein